VNTLPLQHYKIAFATLQHYNIAMLHYNLQLTKTTFALALALALVLAFTMIIKESSRNTFY